MNVLVTSSNWKAAIVAMRWLARKGHRVTMLVPDAKDPACASRYCADHHVMPPETERDAYPTALADLAATRSFDLLVPCSDHVVDYLSGDPTRFSRLGRFCVPSRASVDIALDKHLTHLFAGRSSIPTPTTWCVRSPAEVDTIVGNLSWPCIVKPRSGTGSDGVHVAATPTEAKAAVRSLIGAGKSRPLVQALVPGNFVGYSAICSEGNVLNEFMHTTSRSLSFGGTPPAATSVEQHPARGIAHRVVEQLRWSGAICLDFLEDSRQRPLLLEINPRFSGALELADACGSEQVGTYAALALNGRDTAFKQDPYRAGIRCSFILPEGTSRLKQRPGYALQLVRDVISPSTVTNITWDDPRYLSAMLGGGVRRGMTKARTRVKSWVCPG